MISRANRFLNGGPRDFCFNKYKYIKFKDAFRLNDLIWESDLGDEFQMTQLAKK